MSVALQPFAACVLLLAVVGFLSCGEHKPADDGTRAVEAIPAPSGNAPITTEADIPARPDRSDKDDIYEITATPDTDDPSKTYIPTDLNDCFVELNRMLHPKFIEQLKTRNNEVIDQHFGLGLWMRNNWRLWAGSRLAAYFKQLGIFHPDDMSGIILTSYVRHLNSQPIELEAQIKHYQDYWKKVASQPRRGFTIRGSKNKTQ